MFEQLLKLSMKVKYNLLMKTDRVDANHADIRRK